MCLIALPLVRITLRLERWSKPVRMPTFEICHGCVILDNWQWVIYISCNMILCCRFTINKTVFEYINKNIADLLRNCMEVGND